MRTLTELIARSPARTGMQATAAARPPIQVRDGPAGAPRCHHAAPSCVSPMDREVGPEEEPFGSHPHGAVTFGNEHPRKCHESQLSHRGHYGARMVVACVANRLLGSLIHGPIRIGKTPNRSTYQLI